MNIMDSSSEKKIKIEWADLPPELLSVISDTFSNPRDTVRFRSVCQSWRYSTPTPPSKLSPFLPLSHSIFNELFRFQPNPGYDFLANATAIYIIRLRSHPRLVAVQEATAGNLLLRDALFYKQIEAGAHPDLDPDWIVSTQTLIARSYAHNLRCSVCNGVASTFKMEFMFEPDFSLTESVIPEIKNRCRFSGLELEMVALYAYTVYERSVVLGFWQHLDGSIARINFMGTGFRDFVKFNGRFYAVNQVGHIYFVDPTDFKMCQITGNSVINPSHNVAALSANFLVVDGDLYLVWREDRCSCQIFKLIVVVADENSSKFGCDGILIEKVEDLGDRVFFVTRMWSFSISARFLPHPWQGNCIFFSDLQNGMCKCVRDLDCDEHHEVFDVGAQTFSRISSLQGYSDLFSLPAPFVEKPTEY